MRITDQMQRGTTVENMNSALEKLERSSSELSSGKSILEPSDNPYGASRAITLQSQLDGLKSYSTSVQDGVSWTQTSSGALTNIASAMARVRELLISAGNGSLSQGDLSNIATEVTQLTESIKQDANTQYGGQYVFSGTATTTAAYTPGENDEYQGNNGTIARAIGPNATVVVSSELSSVLGNGKASGDGKALDTLRTIVQNLTEGTAEGKAALTTTDLKALTANIESLTQVQSINGSATDQLQQATTRIETLESAITGALSNDEDTDIAKTSIAYSTEQASYEAALRASASIIQESLLNFLK